MSRVNSLEVPLERQLKKGGLPRQVPVSKSGNCLAVPYLLSISVRVNWRVYET